MPSSKYAQSLEFRCDPRRTPRTSGSQKALPVGLAAGYCRGRYRWRSFALDHHDATEAAAAAARREAPAGITITSGPLKRAISAFTLTPSVRSLRSIRIRLPVR